jgi:hypothetical protein
MNSNKVFGDVVDNGTKNCTTMPSSNLRHMPMDKILVLSHGNNI